MQLNKIPLLKTERLFLRPLKDDDLEKISDNISESVVKFLPLIPWPYTINDAKKYLMLVKENESLQKEFTWGIDYKNNLIGTITITFEEFNKIRLSYLLNERFQRNGFMFEAVSKIISYCFVNLNCNKIYTGVIAENISSINLLKKSGFTVDGINRKHILNKGIYVDEFVLSFLRCEFEE